MEPQSEREILERLLAEVRRRIFLNTMAETLVRGSVVTLPLAAILIAVDQRWHGRPSGLVIAGATLIGLLAFSIAKGLKGLGARVSSALTLDERARLKDRISSACEFLDEGELDQARRTQVQDALNHARALDFKMVFRLKWPRFSALLPAVGLALLLSLLVPPISRPTSVMAAADPFKQAQLKQLDELQRELQAKGQAEKELKDVLKKLHAIQRQVEKGQLSERDLMLELARLDQKLRQKTAELGLENLEAEMNTIVPHLMSSAATREAETALQEDKLDKAAEELGKLAEKVKQEKLTQEQK